VNVGTIPRSPSPRAARATSAELVYEIDSA
jgi:hypothetical protein